MPKIFFILFFLAASVSAQIEMSGTEAAELRAKVKTHASSVKTLLSDFVQYKHLDFLSNDIMSTGKLSFKYSNTIKWEYSTPFKYEVLFKNKILFINNEGKKSNINIGSNKIFNQLNKLIVNSITGDMFNENEFDISYFKKETNYEVYFRTKDKNFSKYIEVFQIIFNKEGHVLELKMIESSKDYTRIVFNNRSVNIPLSDALFTQ